MKLTVYLAGEIHSAWRQALVEEVEKLQLDIEFVAPQLDHDLSDDIGEKIMGQQDDSYWRDELGASVNNFRTSILLNKADCVIANFGEDYRQWNTAMDATTAINLGKPIIIIRPKSLIHSLKELSNKANVTVENIEQAAQILAYIYQ